VSQFAEFLRLLGQEEIRGQARSPATLPTIRVKGTELIAWTRGSFDAQTAVVFLLCGGADDFGRRFSGPSLGAIEASMTRKGEADMKPFHIEMPHVPVILLPLLMAALLPLTTASAQSISFKEATNSPVGVGVHPPSVAVADFNLDGNADLAIANASDNTVTVLLGNGNGTFTPASKSPYTVVACFLCNGVPTSVAVGDFNGDGKPDLAIANIPIGLGSLIGAVTGHVGGQVAILLGNGDGTFQGANNFGTGGDFPTSVAVGNFKNRFYNNARPYNDLAVTNLNSGKVSILLNNGSGSFSQAAGSPFAVGSRPSSVAVFDFDQDGNDDLAVANAGDSAVAILMGNGQAAFTPNTNSPVAVGGGPSALVLADFNGDGKMDLAVADLSASAVSVSLGDGTGTFPTVTDYPVGRSPSSIAVGDFNKDGKLDLVVANRLNGSVIFLLGDGKGAFQPARNFSVGGDPLSVAVGDFDGDTEPDVAVANLFSNSVSVVLNTTDIVPPATIATLTPPANGNGWNKTSVSVALSATDNAGGSGVKEIHYTIAANPEVVVAGASTTLNFSAEGTYSIAFHAVDNAGNTEAAQSLSVRIDETPPTITASQSPSANAAGWNKSDVTVSFTCSDALSQIDSCTPPALISTEGGNQTVTGTATDRAGNSATATKTINLDKTPPVLTMPALAASYTYNASLTLAFGATDALSGFASSQATLNGSPIISGTTVTLNHPGTNTFTLTATDVAGNTATQTATFSVLYHFTGFLPPIPNDGSGLFKLGSNVPVKFQLTDAAGASVSNAIANLTVQMFSGSALTGTPIDATPPGSADTGNLFRFDGTQYIYDLSTKPFATGTWQIQARLNDGTVHTVLIGLK